jgi:hypothetical protein
MFLPDQKTRFILTNPEVGLTWDNTIEAIEILNKEL